MTQMVRKQIYIYKRQQATLRRLAKARNLSEAEIIRQAIDQQASGENMLHFRPDSYAWEKARKFMLTLHAQGPLLNRSHQWKREDLYEERMSRYGRSSD